MEYVYGAWNEPYCRVMYMSQMLIELALSTSSRMIMFEIVHPYSLRLSPSLILLSHYRHNAVKFVCIGKDYCRVMYMSQMLIELALST
jgi:hypothetical protein